MIAMATALTACDDAPGGGSGALDAATNDRGAIHDAGLVAEDASATGEDAEAGSPDGDFLDAAALDATPPTDAGFLPLARDRLCDAFTAAYCGAVSACACPATVINRCEPETRALCAEHMLSARVIAKIDDGTIRYDGFAARNFVDRLAATSTTCANVLTGIGWTVGDYFTIGGIFSGTLPGGARCAIEYAPLLPTECGRGVCLEEGGNYQCLPLAIPGERCAGASLCTDLTARLDPSLSLSDNLASPCTRSTSIAPSLCSARFSEGSECDEDFECASHHCDDDTCTSRRGENDMCMRDAQCESGDCGGAAPSSCEAGDLAIGTPCDRGPSCESNVCIQTACAPGVCAGFADTSL